MEEDENGGLTQKNADILRTVAKGQYISDGLIEIDDKAELSTIGEAGCYIQAWVWGEYPEGFSKE